MNSEPPQLKLGKTHNLPYLELARQRLSGLEAFNRPGGPLKAPTYIADSSRVKCMYVKAPGLSLLATYTHIQNPPIGHAQGRLQHTISAAHCGRQPRGPGKGQGGKPGAQNRLRGEGLPGLYTELPFSHVLGPWLSPWPFPGPPGSPLHTLRLHMLESISGCRPECWRDKYLESGD